MESKYSRKFEKSLKKYRKQIDRADKALIQALGLRDRTVKKIGALKKQHSVPVVQNNRWKDLLEHRISIGAKLGLEPAFVQKLFAVIQKDSITQQKAIARVGRNKGQKKSKGKK